MEHILWVCPAWSAVRAAAAGTVGASVDVLRAAAGSLGGHCGLLPAAGASFDLWLATESGPAAVGPWLDDLHEVVWTDGSGDHQGVPGLAVATWGMWWGDGDGRNGCGRTPGTQTVQRSELWAVVCAARARAGRLLVVTDSAYVANGVRGLAGWEGAKDATNGDLWEVLRALGGGREVQARRVPSHRPWPDPPLLSAADWWGNAQADKLAGAALRSHRPPAAAVAAWDRRLLLARGIARVVASVQAAALAAYRAAEGPDGPAAAEGAGPVGGRPAWGQWTARRGKRRIRLAERPALVAAAKVSGWAELAGAAEPEGCHALVAGAGEDFVLSCTRCRRSAGTPSLRGRLAYSGCVAGAGGQRVAWPTQAHVTERVPGGHYRCRRCGRRGLARNRLKFATSRCVARRLVIDGEVHPDDWGQVLCRTLRLDGWGREDAAVGAVGLRPGPLMAAFARGAGLGPARAAAHIAPAPPVVAAGPAAAAEAAALVPPWEGPRRPLCLLRLRPHRLPLAPLGAGRLPDRVVLVGWHVGLWPCQAWPRSGMPCVLGPWLGPEVSSLWAWTLAPPPGRQLWQRDRLRL